MESYDKLFFHSMEFYDKLFCQPGTNDENEKVFFLSY